MKMSGFLPTVVSLFADRHKDRKIATVETVGFPISILYSNEAAANIADIEAGRDAGSNSGELCASWSVAGKWSRITQSGASGILVGET